MIKLERRADYFSGHFNAMACHCEVLIDTHDETLAADITQLVAHEVSRIEQKYSRYRDDNILHQINSGDAIRVDVETTQLLDYAQQLFQLSEARFDITSGVLRRAWHFDGSDNIPSSTDVDRLLPLIGWQKVHWHEPMIQLPTGMEIDFGGIGKEYAADRAAQLLIAAPEKTNTSVLVNLGGDLAVTGPRANGENWQVGIETGARSTPAAPTTPGHLSPAHFSLSHGGVATSGDRHRYLQKDGVRYSHVLDPRTGWPVQDAPTAVTVVAATCTDAGMLSTLALLHGPGAEDFLREQGVSYWCQW